ncbi:ankyrin repeat-containing domain protein, partial [Amanita rubescens]
KYKQWLTPPDPSTNFNNALKNHLDDTGSWLLNSPTYLEWKQRDNSFLWIHGISGSGKTILCSTLIKAIKQQTDNKNSSLTYFFCDVSNINKGTARGLLCSLVFTLCTPQNQEVLKDLFQKCNNGHQKPSDHDLYEVLRSYLSGFQDVYLFIDALDECANVEEVLDLVKLINRWGIRSCHLLVTSRKELPIVNSLRQAMPTELYLTSMPVNQDIANYIDHMLFYATELKTWNPCAKELIKVTLTKKGKGMFRWVACQLEELKHCSKSDSMLRQKLNGLPTTLNSIYDQILTRIEEADAMNAMKLLLWLTFSERPIHIEDLAIILEFDVESQQFDVDAKLHYPDDVLKICSSLVTKMEDETVQFAHASVKEYFQSDKRKIGSSVEVDPCFGHCFIGQCSLTYILQRRQVIPPDGGKDPSAAARFKKSLLQYAAYFWPKHILACKQESAVMKQILNLFESQNLTYWVHAYNYDWGYNFVRMIYPNYIQIAALHGLIETAKQLMSQPISSVECMEALEGAASNGHMKMVTLLLEKGNIKVASYLYCWALEEASRGGETQIVSLLCKHGKDSDIKNAVTQAAHNGHIKLVQLLLETESDEKKKMKLALTAVYWAAVYGYKAVVEHLLSKVELSKTSESLVSLPVSDNVVLAASRAGHVDIVQLLLDRGREVNYNVYRRQVNHALFAAAKEGHERLVVLLLEQGADPNIQGQILHDAALKGHKNIVQLLIDNGADVNAQGGNYGHAIWAAMSEGYNEIVELLLQHGASPSVHSGYDDAKALVVACKCGYRNMVEQLLDEGVDANEGAYMVLDKVSQHKHTPLHVASEYASEDIVRLLLEKGVDVNIVGGHRGSALHTAAYHGKKEIVQLLLKWGANVNIQAGTSHGSPLMEASSKGHKPIVQLLLEWGADVNLHSSGENGSSALIEASSHGHKSIVELLLEWGADVNLHCEGPYGSALIAVASCWGDHKSIVEMLLSQGADVNFCDKRHESALIKAASGGNKDAVQMLLQSGADVNIQGENLGSALYAAANGEVHNTEIVQLLLAHGA